MIEALRAGNAPPFPQGIPMQDAEPARAPMFDRIKLFSAGGMFGRGLMLIAGEMAQMVFAFIFMLFAVACCVALALKVEAATHFMGVDFTPPRAVVSALGGLMDDSPTFLVIGLLAAIFGIKLLDLIVRVLRRRAQLAEIGYPAVVRAPVQPEGVPDDRPIAPVVNRSTSIVASRKPSLRRRAAGDPSAPAVAKVLVQRSAPETGGEPATDLVASPPSGARIGRAWSQPFRYTAAAPEGESEA